MTLQFKNQGRQGDVLFRKTDKLPDSADPAQPQDGKYILAHSETGHHHTVMERPDVKVYNDRFNTFMSYLVIEKPIEIIHHRENRKHETQVPTEPGVYEVRRQRRSAFDGAIKRVLD